MTRFITALCSYCVLPYLFLIQAATAEMATIATASNFKAAMDELIYHFQQHFPHQLRQTNASSGVLFNQISYGAPFDVFLAANSYYPKLLADQGQAFSDSRYTYAHGKLVLLSTSPLEISSSKSQQAVTNILTTALSNGDKIAIANPDTAPYGIAAQQALDHLGLWQNHQAQLVRGNNVGQSFQFVATGNVAFGFAALSQLNALTAQQQHSALYAWPLPEHWYQPIRQQAILLQSGKDNPAAVAFLDFLTSNEAKSIIRRHGYSAPTMAEAQ